MQRQDGRNKDHQGDNNRLNYLPTAAMRRFLLAGSVLLPVRAFGGLSPLLASTLQGGAQVAPRLTTGALPAHATALLRAFPGLGAPTAVALLFAPIRAFGGVVPNDSGFFWRQCHVVCFAHGHQNYRS